jgi:hypothetical protein
MSLLVYAMCVGKISSVSMYPRMVNLLGTEFFNALTIVRKIVQNVSIGCKPSYTILTSRSSSVIVVVGLVKG